jgi:orotate phosphoribosyltransferase
MRTRLVDLLDARKGHFQLESGHHGDLWLDLDALFLRPQGLQQFVGELANRLSTGHIRIQAICGPLTGGAFLAQMIAAALGVEFYYAERIAPQQPLPHDRLFSVAYRVPAALRGRIRGKNVVVVDDVVNAGSAIRATLADLRACGATPLEIGALLTLGDAASQLAAENNIPLKSLTHLTSGLWTPAACPLCAEGVPLEDLRPTP